jgi:calcineurin-like phosphoesterase family protein
MSALEYRKKLKGNITFIEGNHDDPELGAVRSAILDYGGFHFLLIHDPAKTPGTFDGWVIHGHHHNNNLPRYPFIDFLNRRVNVSAEAIGYIPVNLNTICNLIRERISEGNTQPVFLSYRYGSEK